jgi:mono/diheme cytochrome c family protein
MWRTSRRDREVGSISLLLLSLAGLLGCRQDMHDQPKLEPLERSPMFADGRGSRDPVDGTVARGQLRADRHLHEGRRDTVEPGGDPQGELVDTFPIEVTRTLLERGRERYDIFCSPCHARTGDGDGMIVRRGYRRPPQLWDEKLRSASVGHLFDVITRGIGVMPAYARQVPAEDRWAIVAYLRALQLANWAELDALPPAERERAVAALKDAPAKGGER